METVRVDDLKLGPLIGEGACGSVYRWQDPAGVACMVKILEDMAISRSVLKTMTGRLAAGGWPSGVMPVISSNFASQRPFLIMPQMAEGAAGEIPRSLQMRLAKHPGPESWALVRELAAALAQMHDRRVSHGNLKPGNVFFSEAGGVLLSDWALGNMPGVVQLDFTDALLYQPPEQLRDSAGHLAEAGYRWDVFAFGVLAYRLVTGKFPRCDEAFQSVAPAAGETRWDGIQADFGVIAAGLEAEPGITWPSAEVSPLVARFRGWLERCLPLDPTQRLATMTEVSAGFETLEKQVTMEAERAAMVDQRQKAARRTRRIWLYAAGATATAALLGGLWLLTHSLLRNERRDRTSDVTRLGATTDAAVLAKADAETKKGLAEKTLTDERRWTLAQLEASRLIGDRLFSWAMEKGNRNLPPLDGRDLRLKRLEHYFTDFLAQHAEVPALADERARARLQLAEISLAAEDATAASQRLDEALTAWANLPMNAELKFRFARDSLLLALLRQAHADPEAEASFTAARAALVAVPPTEVEADELDPLFAILDFHEAKLLAARGEDARALQQLLHATETLNRIADQRPDVAILRSELAACYLSSATILEGMGKLGDAREVRNQASVELVKLVKEKPEDFALRLDLAGCYSAMAESAVLAGDITGAETISGEAMRFLEKLVVEQPDNAEAVSRQASQLGLRAGIQRDKGFHAEALKDYDQGLRMLEAMHASAPANAIVSYRLALLWWQKGRMLGMAGNRDEEISLIQRARDLLGQLEAEGPASGQRPEQLRSSGAYLRGDLGHSLQLANRKPEASAAFKDAILIWEKLLTSRPESEEYNEGLTWCRQRLEDLK
jgi:eukaryotic-like serine/threonine-protein kinase